MNENNFDAEKQLRYPLKAEEIDHETLQRIMRNLEYRRAIEDGIKNALNEKDKKIVEVWGTKGVGKSAHILGTLAQIVEETYKRVKDDIEISDIPVMFSFDPTGGKIEIVDPSKYVSKEVLNILREKGYFGEEDTDEKKKEWVKESKVIVLDNIHYLAEKVSDNPNAKEMLKRIFKEVLYEVSKNRKVIILSTEIPLRLLKLDDKELEEFKKEIMEKTGGEIEIRPPSIESLCKVYGVKLDEIVKKWWKGCSDQLPRSFVNLSNKYGRRKDEHGIAEITVEEIIKKNYDYLKRELLESGLNEELSEFVLNHPRLPLLPQELLKEIKMVEKKYGELKDIKELSGYKNKLSKEMKSLKEQIEELEKKDVVKEYDNLWDWKIQAELSSEEWVRKIGTLIEDPLVEKRNDLRKKYEQTESMKELVEELCSYFSEGGAYKELLDMGNDDMGKVKEYLKKISEFYEIYKDEYGFRIDNMGRLSPQIVFSILRAEINRGSYLDTVVKAYNMG